MQEAFVVALERWPRDGVPRQPGRLDHPGRPQQGDRPPAPRARAAGQAPRCSRRSSALRARSRGSRRRGPGEIAGRPAAADLHLLPPGAGARGAGGADAAHARRPHAPRRSPAPSWSPRRRWRSGWCAPSARSATRGSPTRCRDADAAARAAAGGAGDALPDLQRGLPGLRRRRAGPDRALRARRSGWPACWSSCCPASPRRAALLALMLLHDSRRAARARRRRRARAARRPGPLALGPRADRGGRSRCSRARPRAAGRAVHGPGARSPPSTRGAERGGDRLAADRPRSTAGSLRARARPGRRAQPRRRGGDGRRARSAGSS